MAILFVRISVGLISIVVILCVKAVGMNAHELHRVHEGGKGRSSVGLLVVRHRLGKPKEFLIKQRKETPLRFYRR